MEQLYIVVDRVYFRKCGLGRTIRFSQVFESFERTMEFYATLDKYEDYDIVPISKSEYLKLKERYKECF